MAEEGLRQQVADLPRGKDDLTRQLVEMTTERNKLRANLFGTEYWYRELQKADRTWKDLQREVDTLKDERRELVVGQKDARDKLAEAQDTIEILRHQNTCAARSIRYAEEDKEKAQEQLAQSDAECEIQRRMTHAFRLRTQEAEADAAAMRLALEGANWIIGKLAPHEALAIQIRGYQVDPMDVEQGAKYRAMIDDALSSPTGQELAERVRLLEDVAEKALSLARNLPDCTIDWARAGIGNSNANVIQHWRDELMAALAKLDKKE